LWYKNYQLCGTTKIRGTILKINTLQYLLVQKISHIFAVQFKLIMNKDMVDKTENISYTARPKGKPDESLKGKLNKWNNGYAEFIPAGSKPSNRTMLKQLGGSSFYKSEGEKDSSWSLHLNVDAKDCADPVAALH
jgi:hypothetical protein